MKKKWYRGNFIKALWIILEHVSLAALMVSLVLISDMAGDGISIWSQKSDSYVESEALTTRMHQSSLEILYGIKSKKYIDDEEDKVIDLLEFDKGEELSYKNTSGLAYSISDLMNWAKSSWSFYDGENILVCTKSDGSYEYFYYEDFLEKIKTGELQFVVDAESTGQYASDSFNMRTQSVSGMSNVRTQIEEEIISNVLSLLSDNILQDGLHQEGILYVTDAEGEMAYEDVWNFGTYSLKEKYAPEGADSILEVLNESEYWNGKLTEAYNMLGSLLSVVQSNLGQVKVLDTYKEGNTNLFYMLVDLEKQEIYSNRKDVSFSQYETMLDKIKNEGHYLVLSPTLAECETDLRLNKYMTLKEWQNMVNNQAVSEEYIFAMQIDEEFPIGDEFANSNLLYEKYVKLQMPILVLGIMSAIVFLIGLVWLTLAAGRRQNDEVLHLCFFDHWFTEIAAGIVFCVWSSCLAILLDGWIVSNIIESCVLAGCVGAMTAICFLTGYLSLVRRIKAKNLWKKSLIRWIFEMCRKIYRTAISCTKKVLELFEKNTNSKVKIVLVTGAFLALQFILCGIIFNGGAVMILVLMAADVVILILLLRWAYGEDLILDGLKRITDGELHYKIPLERLYGDQKRTAEYINHIGEGLDAAVENSIKNERMKTELITNVSHDIKTPLTSIINYIDLLKRENFTDPKVRGYLDVLESKAQRLKVLTDDVVEASKASTGNISLDMVELNFVEMVNQVVGEFEEKFRENNLTSVIRLTDQPAIILADGRRMWRVLENVFNNVVKYAMEGTRVYIDVEIFQGKVTFSIKNISAQPLNISADELTERFIRGDVSRNTEGSGLGLSIAKSLTELQSGEFKLYLDGDLFKVIIVFSAR